MKSAQPKINAQSDIWKWFKICLAIGLVILVISKTDLEQFESLGGRFSLQWLIYCCIFFILLTLLKAFQYYILVGGNLAYRSVLRIVIWQNLLSNFIASSAGVASYFVMFRVDEGVKLRYSGSAFLIVKAGDLLAIGCYLGLSTGMVWNAIPSLHVLTVLVTSAILAIWIIVLLAIVWRTYFIRFYEWLLTKLGLEKVAVLVRIQEILRLWAGENQGKILRTFWVGTFLSLVYMAATMVFSYAAMRIFIVSISVWPVVFVASILQVLSFIPIQVLGGLGVNDVTSVYFYNIFGFPQSEMSAIMLSLRAIFLLMNAATLIYLPISSITKPKGENTKTSGHIGN